MEIREMPILRLHMMKKYNLRGGVVSVPVRFFSFNRRKRIYGLNWPPPLEVEGIIFNPSAINDSDKCLSFYVDEIILRKEMEEYYWP